MSRERIDIVRVDVVIVTFDPTPGMLEAAITSVLEHSSHTSEHLVTIRVVDNGGRAAALLAASNWRGQPLADLVESTTNPSNLGFGAGVNVGLAAARAAGADAIVVLNDDTVATDGWLERMLAEFDDPAVGAVQPLLVSSDASTINSAGVDIDDFGAGADRLRSEPVAAAGTEAIDIEVFTGGAVALSRPFVDDVGVFDGRFFLYYEDVDLARRGTARGWRYRLVPTAVVEHRGSATTVALGNRTVFLRERNRLWATAMHGSVRDIGAALRLSVRRLRHPPRRMHARALAAGLVGVTRRLAGRAVGRLVGFRGRSHRGRARRLVGTPGVNLVGYHHISSGLGSNARELSAALQAAGVPVIEIDNDLSSSPRRRPARPVPDELHDTTIAIVTAFEFEHFIERFPQLVGPGKRMNAYWVWELEQIPERHVIASRHVDEVWTPTNFVRDAYASALADRATVRLAPFRMEEPPAPATAVEAWRTQWGDDIVFVVSFDYLSIVERKNPLGAIRAFRTAFDGSPQPVRLVVKSINGHQRRDDLAHVAGECAGDRRIDLLDEHLDDDRHHGLLAAADVLVSLHRSEGYGLHPAIAMWLGTPAIATRYSGVVDFMDDDVAAMVDHDLVPVTNGQGIYPETANWADPDIAHAVEQMRRLAADPGLRVRLGRAGHRRIADQPTAAQFGEGYAALLRTPAGAPAAFFDGLDAARPSLVTKLHRRIRGAAWPDTARR